MTNRKVDFSALLVTLSIVASCNSQPGDGHDKLHNTNSINDSATKTERSNAELTADVTGNIVHFSGGITVCNRLLLYTDAREGLQYIDIETATAGDIVKQPFCFATNCAHDINDESCTAVLLADVVNPFVINDNLYYFRHESESYDNGFYKADIIGENHELIFRAQDNHYLWFPTFSSESLIFAYCEEDYDDIGNMIRKFFIYIYDFGEVELVCETEMKYALEIILYGLLGNEVYVNYIARDYPFEYHDDYDVLVELTRDKSSTYYQGLTSEIRKFHRNQKNPANPEYETVLSDSRVAILNNSYYTVEDCDVVKVSTANEREIVFTADNTRGLSLGVYDNKLFISTADFSNDGDYLGNDSIYCYDASDIFLIGSLIDGQIMNISFETNDYFFGSIAGAEDYTAGYILKTDYYNGNWSNFTKWHWWE